MHQEGMSCPVSTCGRLGRLLGGRVEQRLEGAVLGGVVADVVLPAAPDDVYPGSAEDAHGVGMVMSSGDGFGVKVGGPGVVVAGVAGEVADGVSEFFVGSPAEGDGLDLAGLAGRGWVFRARRIATKASVVTAWVSASGPVVPRGAASSCACRTSEAVWPL